MNKKLIEKDGFLIDKNGNKIKIIGGCNGVVKIETREINKKLPVKHKKSRQ